MTCQKCGAQSAPNAAFCNRCGNKITVNTSTSDDFYSPPRQTYQNQPQPYQNPQPMNYENTQAVRPYEHTENLPGKIMLMVISIILIVVCAIFTLGIIVNIFTFNAWLPLFGGSAMRSAWIFYYGGNLIFGIYGVIIGIIGVMNCNKREMAGTLQGLGIGYLVIMALILIIVLPMGVFGHLGVLAIGGMPFDVVMGILFIVGASKNK